MSLLKYFTSLDEKKSQLAADKEKIAAKERGLEQDEYLARQRDGLLLSVDASKADYATKCSTLDKVAVDFSDGDFAQHFLNGCNGSDTDFTLIGNLATRAVAVAELKRRLPKLKSKLEKLIIFPAKKALADFERANKTVLSKIPPPKRVVEIPFTPASPVDDDERKPNLPSAGVRQMLGLKIGERAFSGYEEPQGNGEITIRDLDAADQA